MPKYYTCWNITKYCNNYELDKEYYSGKDHLAQFVGHENTIKLISVIKILFCYVRYFKSLTLRYVVAWSSQNVTVM